MVNLIAWVIVTPDGYQSSHGLPLLIDDHERAAFVERATRPVDSDLRRVKRVFVRIEEDSIPDDVLAALDRKETK